MRINLYLILFDAAPEADYIGDARDTAKHGFDRPVLYCPLLQQRHLGCFDEVAINLTYARGQRAQQRGYPFRKVDAM